MNDSYIFLIATVSGKPPNGKERRAHRKDYIFAPLGGDEIFSVDTDSWSNDREVVERIFFPNERECNLMLERAVSSKQRFLVGLSDKKELNIPGRGLTNLEKLTSLHGLNNLIEVGYDVVDSYGLSAIVNIGYATDEIASIERLDIEINNYGLIGCESDAVKFSRFAETSAKEHSPFYSINVLLLEAG